MNYSATNFKKIEALFKDLGYALRYEKGNFNSGYCIIKDKNVVIINRYFTDDVKFQKLLDIIQTLEIREIQTLSEANYKLLEKLNHPATAPIPFDESK